MLIIFTQRFIWGYPWCRHCLHGASSKFINGAGLYLSFKQVIVGDYATHFYYFFSATTTEESHAGNYKCHVCRLNPMYKWWICPRRVTSKLGICREGNFEWRSYHKLVAEKTLVWPCLKQHLSSIRWWSKTGWYCQRTQCRWSFNTWTTPREHVRRFLSSGGRRVWAQELQVLVRLHSWWTIILNQFHWHWYSFWYHYRWFGRVMSSFGGTSRALIIYYSGKSDLQCQYQLANR